MGFYQDQIVSLLINLSMRQQSFADYRRRVVPAAEGRVLEIGVGSGLNLPFYSERVRQVIGLDRVSCAQDDEAFDEILQLPHVARPAIREQ